MTASGTVQAAKQVSLNFSGSGGEITAINVKVGDHVKAGQVLATLDDSTAKTQVKNAEANLAAEQAHLDEATQGSTPDEIAVQQANVDKAKVELDAAKNTYNIQKNLYASGAVSKSDLDQAKNSLDQAQASYDSAVAQLNQTKAPPKSATVQAAQAAVAQAQTQLQQQQIALDKLSLKAPMDGVITQVNGDVGEIPSNNPFMVMDDSDSGNLEVMAQISQSDIGKIQPGMNATFTTNAYSDKTFNGTVKLVYPEGTTTSSVTTYKVLLTVDNKEGLLKSGMTVNVTIDVGTHKNVLYVPAAALKD
ncbi:HlyD family secretion protein [Effusibacillus dendaii]|uniref:HlyD family secretion protein n=1 Tax=Effusibacillus dendaii TaxID=2743772 RepID=UPI0021F569E4|nr:efflux RND transporter periplasmic adaptor subunit [Effusibacillus dendaii]